MPFDRQATDEAEFERRLLASARGDSGPPDLAGAWAKLAGALGPVVSDPALGGGPRATGSAAASFPASTAGVRAVRVAAMRWMLLGAVVGSAATATVLARSRFGRPDTLVPAVGRQATMPGELVGARPAQPALLPVEETLVRRQRSASLHGGRAKRAIEPRGHAYAQTDGGNSTDEEGGTVAAGASALAAEVARLDAARTSNAIGDYDGTIRLIERYHRDFPNGALAPDADVVALEAVAAKRDRPETSRRAALFLSRYPRDPHAARVKSLGEH